MQEVQEYIDCMNQVKSRLQYIDNIIDFASGEQSVFALETIALQLRKILEIVAFSSISPCKGLYEQVRLKYGCDDYTKDWNAKSILRAMDNVNPDFYPNPFMILEGVHHQDGQSGRKIVPISDEYLTRKEFDSLYKRLGKYLHADNPWGTDKGILNFRTDVPSYLAKIKRLLNYHLVKIKMAERHVLWMVEMGSYGKSPQMLIAEPVSQSAS